ncbi:conserved virulence factor C family protein [Paenactinomyces guangxiensis]|uniref:Conserved virulence factor C family protein n=1 Tax=Paenactinomyces guangxiensis TaxID=1490290 RepID=A0A7W1WRZ6_9BACL|nr:conserved virulence factor C family protein [Paenactinomyces guangxiensis]MBA4494963.1 conserved virulence factor C family protein [Paenactinomyces guangxiensis]MBH8592046.1 conserved virulence factor C family protein [Paenactinomyces guangxiensis]
MKIVSIEPTPSPNVMKLNVDESLPAGTSYNFSQNQKEQAPEHIRTLLSVDGVKSVFQVLDFISLERHPKADWQTVLSQARKVLGEANRKHKGDSVTEEQKKPADSFGEVSVYIQKLKGIPMQIKLVKDGEEVRVGLPDRFKEAVMKAQKATTNLVFERKWEEQTPRYGDVEEVGQQVAEEISAAYDETRLHRLVERALTPEKTDQTKKEEISAEEVLQAFESPEWEKRYAALEQFEPALESIAVLDKALNDSKPAIRRLAVVYLGIIEKKEVLPYLYRALKDPSAIVRRTAGDCLSDMGDPDAIPAMCEALKDKNKLVRWRAARFLFEVGDETAIPALKEAVDDPEFEVKMQAQIALERIERGEEASGTVWQQMTKSISEGKKE